MLATQVLGQVEPQRLLKATEGLVNGAFTIIVTRCEDDAVEGFVRNVDTVEYSVVLTPSRTFCNCKDSMFLTPFANIKRFWRCIRFATHR